MSRAGIANYEFTAEERKLVEMVAGVGLAHEQICYLIEREDAEGVKRPISADTLKRHFKEELAMGKAKTIAKVAGKLVSTALGTPSAQATTSQIFYLKTQAGWKETAGLELSSPDDADGDQTSVAAKVAGLIERGLRRSTEDGSGTVQ